jgi:hypothetical protein
MLCHLSLVDGESGLLDPCTRVAELVYLVYLVNCGRLNHRYGCGISFQTKEF